MFVLKWKCRRIKGRQCFRRTNKWSTSRITDVSKDNANCYNSETETDCKLTMNNQIKEMFICNILSDTLLSCVMYSFIDSNIFEQSKVVFNDAFIVWISYLKIQFIKQKMGGCLWKIKELWRKNNRPTVLQLLLQIFEQFKSVDRVFFRHNFFLLPRASAPFISEVVLSGMNAFPGI